MLCCVCDWLLDSMVTRELKASFEGKVMELSLAVATFCVIFF